MLVDQVILQSGTKSITQLMMKNFKVDADIPLAHSNKNCTFLEVAICIVERDKCVNVQTKYLCMILTI